MTKKIENNSDRVLWLNVNECEWKYECECECECQYVDVPTYV